MKSNFLRNKVKGAVLALSLVFGIGLATSMTAQAQYRNQDYERQQRQRQRDYEREQRRRQRDAERDQRRNRNNGGYNDGYYNDGYNNNGGYDNRRTDGYGNYGGSNDLRQTALNEGFNEGMKQGRNDRSRGDRYNYTDEDEFQKGTKSYSSRLGNKEIYRRYFREAFSHGYADGYGGY